MLRSLTLKNFRCFEDFTIEPLERVNLIGGKNNVGKTSLLEGILIFQHPGNASMLTQTGRLRYSMGDLEVIQGFFFDQDINNKIQIQGIGRDDLEEILNISCEYEYEIVPLEENKNAEQYISLTTEQKYNSLLFEYISSRGRKNIAKLLFASDSSILKATGWVTRKLKVANTNFISTNKISSQENAEYYSNLERIGKQEEVLETIRLLEPHLKRLSLIVVKGEPIICGDIGMSELVPLALMGEGIGRLFSTVLAIANTKNGTVLIDEIENGLHYSVLVDVWKAIADAARRHDVQIFATTHSRECILAAHEAFKNSDSYDFRYHRLDRVKDKIQAFTYDQEALETSDEFNWEMR